MPLSVLPARAVTTVWLDQSSHSNARLQGACLHNINVLPALHLYKCMRVACLSQHVLPDEPRIVPCASAMLRTKGKHSATCVTKALIRMRLEALPASHVGMAIHARKEAFTRSRPAVSLARMQMAALSAGQTVRSARWALNVGAVRRRQRHAHLVMLHPHEVYLSATSALLASTRIPRERRSAISASPAPFASRVALRRCRARVAPTRTQPASLVEQSADGARSGTHVARAALRQHRAAQAHTLRLRASLHA